MALVGEQRRMRRIAGVLSLLLLLLLEHARAEKHHPIVCSAQTVLQMVTTWCICAPCDHCEFDFLRLQCELMANETVVSMVDEIDRNATFEQPSLAPEDWFLTEDEITASRGGVPRDDLLTWSDGNHVEIFTATNKFFSSVYYDVGNTTAPGQIFITGWEITNIPFLPKSEEWEDSRFQAMIGRALDRGVNVSVLLWTNLFHPHKTSVLQSAVNAHVNGTWLFDNRLPWLTSSHHQKTIVLASDSHSIAYVGGIDLTLDRWDTRFHNVSVFRKLHGIASNFNGWIDASLRLEGPVVHDVAANFVGRWNEQRTPLEGAIEFSNPNVFEQIQSIALNQTAANTASNTGTMSVQLTRTYSCKIADGGYAFAPKGEISILEARIKAIRQARNFVYVEDQYFIHVPQLQQALLEVLPRIKALVVVAQEPPLVTSLTGYEILLYRMIHPLVEQFPGKVFAFAPRASLSLYVHTKVVIVDDVFLSVGSSNWNRRSMTSDSEVTANVVDREQAAVAPEGVAVSALARSFRVQKFSEFSGISSHEIDGMHFMDALWHLHAAANNASSGSIIGPLHVDSSAYFHVYPTGFEDDVDPEDVYFWGVPCAVVRSEGWQRPITLQDGSLASPLVVSSAMTSASPAKKQPLFDSPSKYGVHPSIGAFIPTEQRFKWQESNNPTDAMYALPSSVGKGPKKSFGTSTREDWDPTRKRTNDCAGPGSYKAPDSCGRQPSSLCRSSSVTAFENAPRSPLRSDTTPSPGPIYEIATTVGLSPTAKFGTSKRQPLNGRSEGPGPNLMLKSSFPEARQGVSPTFGTQKRGVTPGAGGGAPGPIYDLDPTGFRTGAVLSFSKAKRF